MLVSLNRLSTKNRSKGCAVDQCSKALKFSEARKQSQMTFGIFKLLGILAELHQDVPFLHRSYSGIQFSCRKGQITEIALVCVV